MSDFQLGVSAAYEALRLKTPMTKSLQAAYHHAGSPARDAMFSGMLNVMVVALDAIQASLELPQAPRLQVRTENALAQQIIDARPAERRLLIVAATSGPKSQDVADILGTLAGVIFMFREIFASVKLVEAADIREPLVAGMPTRVATFEVERNADGDIARILRREQDA